MTGGKRRPGSTTKAEDDTKDGGLEVFIPGQDGNLAWNTTADIRDKPILVYVYSCQDTKGDGFDYSKAVERGMLTDKELRKFSRNFICEKICAGDDEFLRKVKGREPVQEYLSTMKEKDQRQTHVAFLDSEGKLIAKFTDKKMLKKGTPALMAQMKETLKENERRVLAAGEKDQ